MPTKSVKATSEKEIYCSCGILYPASFYSMFAAYVPLASSPIFYKAPSCPSCKPTYWQPAVKFWHLETGLPKDWHMAKCPLCDAMVNKCFCESTPCSMGPVQCYACMKKEAYAICDPDDKTPCACNRCKQWGLAPPTF